MAYTEEELFNMSDEEFNSKLDSILEDNSAVEADDVSPEEESAPNNEQVSEPESKQQTEQDNSSNESASTEEQTGSDTQPNTEINNVEQPSEDSTEDKKTETLDVFTIRAAKQDYTLTLDELKNLASKGIDYTKKTQQFKEFLPAIEALKNNGIKPEDTNLFIDIMKGNKEALKSLIKSQNIDVMDLDDTLTPEEDKKDYTPTEYRPDYAKQEMDEVVARIGKEPEFQQTLAVVQNLDEQSKEFIKATPSALEDLQSDIKNGIYQPIMQKANSIALRDGFTRPILEYYSYAAREFNQEQQSLASNQQQQANQDNITREANRAKASIPNQGNVARTAISNPDNAQDYIYNMSDEEFAKYLETLN